MTDLTFYLGRYFDPKTAKLTNKDLNYDSADLTTHAVVTGMTGSGKTGLCVALLEEAALNGIPAVIIDPKGDLTNLLLHFPELLPQDFQPWIDPEVARRANMTPEKAAQEAAEAWGDGLKEWGMTQERIMDLKNSVKFSIYTPGSNSGIPVSVLSSLDAPGLNWEENREAIREKIASTVTALLGLVGMNDLDPIRSREHILLSNIFEEHWSQGLENGSRHRTACSPTRCGEASSSHPWLSDAGEGEHDWWGRASMPEGSPWGRRVRKVRVR